MVGMLICLENGLHRKFKIVRKGFLKVERLKYNIRWLLVVGWMCVIFYFSSQEGAVSHQRSFTIAFYIERIIEYVFARDIITDFNRKSFEFFVRKLAHVSEYFVLNMLFYKSFYAKERNYKKSAIKSFIFSFLYAVSDEIHQMFVAGRGPSPVDVGVDSIGMFLYLIPKLLKGKLKKGQGSVI